MSPGWEDLVARVAGDSSHLLGRARLVTLAQSRDLARLAIELSTAYGAWFEVAPGFTAEQLEAAIRRLGARHLAVLARWRRRREAALTPLFLDEDRRSLRALLRGASAGVPAGERLTGLVPTPSLPERALEELSRQPSLNAVAALLSAWGHPFGHPLLELTREPQSDLLRIDACLNTTYVSCSLDAVRHAPRGQAARRALLGYIQDATDVENASTALQLAGQPSTVPREALYNEGGRLLDRAKFLAIAAAPDGAVALSLIERAFRSSALATERFSALSFDDATFVARLQQYIRDARQRPLGAAGILAFFLRVRAEVRDLSLMVWRLAVGAPPVQPAQLLSVK